MGTDNHGNVVGSGVDQPNKPGLGSRIMEKISQGPEKTTKDSDDAKARRVEQEKTAFDLDHKPTERDAQIDGSGARFETDG